MVVVFDDWGWSEKMNKRGQKEASSELLAAICDALEVSLSDVLASVSSQVAEAESTPRTLTSV